MIDHHVTGDGLGDVQLVDPEAAATGEIVFGLFKAAGWPLTRPVVEAIYGYFNRYGLVSIWERRQPNFYAAAELINAGARPDVLYRRMYQSFSPSRLRLMVRCSNI